MGKEDGQMFRCDRPERAHANGEKTVAFLNEHDKARSEWMEVAWEDPNGVTIRSLLCPECVAKYKVVREEQRRQMHSFMNSGEN